MRLKQIKKGSWYETTAGVGQALQVGGVHPPAVKFNITHPMPFGLRWVVPRDVLREVEAPQ